eukprot:gnl/TRDRNA2_/TRDRNA2_163591_c0_seq2.p1 gnl/TRDRNA2_/TRDRNA2_163591_c0~~gnl/TRDRNA2_/TRDRNA2_163591_c0_seq2.p1  ORF type:complete len:515 (+),score=86.91 gnl/TRDRNA2_/TRDRNA2_163591_c0_seq2:49-1545(+)
MSAVASAARDFASGPQVVEAARRLLDAHPLPSLCEALINAQPNDADCLLDAIERLAEFEEVRAAFLGQEVLLGFLREGAARPEPRVRGLVAKILARQAQLGDEASVERLAASGLLDACELLLLGEETGVAESAASAILSSCRHPAGLRAVVGSDASACIVSRLLGRLDGQAGAQKASDIVAIRLLHLFVDLGRSSDEIFAALEARGCFKRVLAAFLTDDILLKLNAVELMDSFGSYKAGQDLLCREGVPEHLARDLINPIDDSIQLCVTRLLGCVLRRAPDKLSALLPSRDAPLAQAIGSFLASRDVSQKLCALGAWANISAHPAGVAFFVQWPELMQAIAAMVASPLHEVCKGAMAAWAAVLGGEGEASKSDVAGIWAMAQQKVLPLVLKNLASKPFPDVRGHVWRLLAILVQPTQAAQTILVSEEIRDTLLDFTSETEYDARIAKHEFVQQLVKLHGSWIGSFLDEKVEEMLQEYSKQGACWRPNEATLIVGDGTA